MRKLTYRNAQIPPPLITDWSNPGNDWTLLNNEHFVRGVDGKELATYTSNSLTEWYVWASDMVGKIKGNAKYFFFKDHLGSVRAVVDNNFNLISAVDGACPRVLLAGDMWGDKMQGRICNGDSTKFGFTGKEEDEESYYDYFGARYYDGRVVRWGSVDPLLEKHFDFSPYNYVLDNPLMLIDPDGKQSIAIGGFVKELLYRSSRIASPVVDIPFTPLDVFVRVFMGSLGTMDTKESQSIFVLGEGGYLEYIEPIEGIAITSLEMSKGGKKQIWPDQYVAKKPKRIKEIDWSKGDQELADQITGGESPKGPKTPNNEIKKWFREHRPKNQPNRVMKIIEERNDE